MTLTSGTLVRRVGVGVGRGDSGHWYVTQTQLRIWGVTKHQNLSRSIVMQYKCWHDCWWTMSVFFFLFLCPVWQWEGQDRVREAWLSWPPQIFTWRESAVGSINSSASTAVRQAPGLSVTSCFTDKRNSGKEQSVNSFLWLSYCTREATVIIVPVTGTQCVSKTGQTWRHGVKCYRPQFAGQT